MNKVSDKASQIDYSLLSAHMMTLDKSKIVEILVASLKNAEKLRRELDDITNTIR